MIPAAIGPSQILAALAVFVLGCAVGSFLNVLIWRFPRGLSVSVPRRSFCPHCERPIRSSDNIPILSYLLLRGKCRHCGAPISGRYPLVEALTGVLLAALYVVQRVGAGTDPGEVIVMGAMTALLIAASAVDMEWFIIPDEFSVFGIAGGLLAGLLLPGLHVGAQPYHTLQSLTGLRHLDGLIGSGIGALGGGALVLVFAVLGTLVFRKEAIGFGDVKLMAMVGAFLGWKVAFLGFFLAPFFGLLYGIPLLILRDEHVMPFGPFLSSGAVLVALMRTGACGWLVRYLRIAAELLGMLLGIGGGPAL